MSSAFSAEEFRESLSLFATGIAIATTASPEGPVGVTINSFASVSLSPPLVLFSLSRSLRSFQAFEGSSGFAVNILRNDQKELSSRFARAGDDKWSGVDASRGQFGGLLLTNSLACFDCKLHQMYDGGDHAIFVGEVVGLGSEREQEPLIYFRSGYREISNMRLNGASV